jgi:hypothetical protein
MGDSEEWMIVDDDDYFAKSEAGADEGCTEGESCHKCHRVMGEGLIAFRELTHDDWECPKCHFDQTGAHHHVVGLFGELCCGCNKILRGFENSFNGRMSLCCPLCHDRRTKTTSKIVTKTTNKSPAGDLWERDPATDFRCGTPTCNKVVDNGNIISGFGMCNMSH